MPSRLLSLFLIVVLFATLGGYYPLFKLEQITIRSAIKQRLKKSVPENELYHFVFDTDASRNIDWVRPGKEFRLRGNMYDIVHADTLDGKITFSCVNDEQETQLFLALDRMVEDEQSQGRTPIHAKTSRILKAFLSLNYLPAAAEHFFLTNHCFHDFQVTDDEMQSGYLNTISHPPETA